MRTLAILATKLSAHILHLFHRGGSLPGTIGLKIDSDILKGLRFEGPIILVTGTNGKTSTANMITDLMSYSGYKVISNRKGDNLRPGIVTTIVTNSTILGKVKANALVLEVDELNIRHILPNIPVSALVVTNFFRDQLDRAMEMERLISTIESVLPNYDGELILNANDPNVVRLSLKAPKAHVTYYGIEENDYSRTSTKEASEGKFCPKCNERLVYDYYQYSHIGKFHCPNCGFASPKADVSLENIDLINQTFTNEKVKYKNPYEGMYSMYNAAAVMALAKYYHIDYSYVQKVFESAPQPKGRNEKFNLNNLTCVLNLIKNPTGANEVMKVIEMDPSDKNICIVLNDNDQDGTDVSWIYDTFFEKLMKESTKKIVCSGLRANDMALRLYYGGFKGKILIETDLDAAVKSCMETKIVTYCIATYTALLPTRNAILKGMK